MKKQKKLSKKQKQALKKGIVKVALIEWITAGTLLSGMYVTNLVKTNKEYYETMMSQQASIEILVKTQNKLREDLRANNQVKEVKVEYSSAEVIEEVKEDKQSLGTFRLTYYCACAKCCGNYADGITASGKRVEEGKTIAVDTSVIKLGSKVEIDGHTYEAQDTGSAIKGNRIDIYMNSHEECLKKGVEYKEVYLLK